MCRNRPVGLLLLDRLGARTGRVRRHRLRLLNQFPHQRTDTCPSPHSTVSTTDSLQIKEAGNISSPTLIWKTARTGCPMPTVSAALGTHYHIGTVRGFTIRGQWRYLEHDWVAKPGTFIYEPAGEAHTLVITDDSPEPVLIFFAVEGGLIYLDKAIDGGFAAYEDGFTALELVRKYYREAGLDVRKLDALIR